MTIPSWAGSMVSNHREAFKAKHAQDWPGTDDELFAICEGLAGAGSSGAECDEWIMQDMEAHPKLS